MEEPSSEPKENNPANLVSLKTQTSSLRDQIYRMEKDEEFKSGGGRRGSNRGRDSSSSLVGDGGGGGGGGSTRQSFQPFRSTERQRKKLAELEAQLLLASPSLVFQVTKMIETLRV